MKQFVVGAVTAAALAGVVVLSQSKSDARNQAGQADPNEIQIQSGDQNPYTSLKLNNAADQFQFAVVSDRTGGHRAKVFSQSVYRINMLQPQFVMSVGDLIEGYTLNEDTVKAEWDEFDGYVKRLEMPFFYTAGNHDLTNKMMVTKWGERYGKRYYNFTYKNCLFLVLCSENPPNMGTIDEEQQKWVAQTLADNKDVRWTFVFLHKPIWSYQNLDTNGWLAVEKALAGRKYTAFAGHHHRYQKFERNGMTLYQLATTGGGSRLRGPEFGEFDHVAWVTMKKDAPIVTQVLLDGILDDNLEVPDTNEKGAVRKMEPTFVTAGKLMLDGKPLPGMTVAFYRQDGKRMRYTCDGLTDDTGRFKMTTYTKNDGAPAGEFTVTVSVGRGGDATKSPVPEMYGSPETSPLKYTIKEGANDVILELKSK